MALPGDSCQNSKASARLAGKAGIAERWIEIMEAGKQQRREKRRRAVHYKDFCTAGIEPKDFCTLGEGVTPLEAVTEWLRANAPDLWVIAEQDKSDLTPEEAVDRNAAYLKRVVLAR